MHRVLNDMKDSVVKNYATPGLTSALLSKGRVRVFVAERDTTEFITPHTHRFDFVAQVLRGEVENTIYYPDTTNGEQWHSMLLAPVEGGLGKYLMEPIGTSRFRTEASEYFSGDWYSMNADQFHSIRFKKGTEVLFFEGPQIRNTSRILQPVDLDTGELIQTFRVPDWMFKRT